MPNVVAIGQTFAEISRVLDFLKMAATTTLDFKFFYTFNGRNSQERRIA